MANQIIQRDIVLGENSDSIAMGAGVAASIQVSWGALAGGGAATLNITVSNDNFNFVSLLAAPSAMSNAGSTYMLLEPSTPYVHLRIETTAGGSTGAYSIYVNKNRQHVI